MRYSQLFGKTNKSAKQLASINATLLQKAGFVDQTMAGVYSFLPLGLRVLAKIENIIRQEMNKIASEAFLPSIVPLALWQQTGRLSTVDVLLKTVPANKHSAEKNAGEYILNSTHEEVITPIAQKFNGSYKDFPFAVYQIQSKFRNEPRAKSGLLRCREFRMKDLYSFHTSEEDLKRYYEIVKDTYWKVFQRLGLAQDTYLTMASGGDFSDDYSHEFQTICATGEDTIFHAEKAKSTFNREVAPSQAEKVVSREAMKPCEDVFGQGIIGVGELATFLKIPLGQTTKTLIFVTDGQDLVAAAVRGGYDVNEEKLKKVLGCKSIKLASSEQVKQATGAEVGYAGLINLPQTVKVIMDESLKGRVNFECGANKTNYHTINVNFGRDIPKPDKFYDIKTAREGDFYPKTGEKYQVYKTSEIGNIFPLYTKFSKAFGYYFSNEKGDRQPVYMGSYGIGSSRIMGVLVEKFHDDRGIIWPESVAPFSVHVIGLNEKSDAVYQTLDQAGIEVLFDDRADVSAGEKFADADLIGIPIRLVVSSRSKGKIEWKKRNEDKVEIIDLDEVLKRLTDN